MKIRKLTLSDFIPHGDAGISFLSIDFTEDVQIWLGSNGSGKSTSMKQLSLYPSPRSDFEKRGSRSLEIEIEGKCYRLESDYQKPSSPHLFVDCDTDENLNIGRTTDEQRDLITKITGITSFVDSLMMNRIDFPSMPLARRKEFLMTHNPSDIGFVLQLAKQISSKIKACRNNLNRLNDRKITIEQDILGEDVILDLNNEKSKILEELSQFQENLMELELGERVIGPSTIPSTYDMKSITTTLRNTRVAMSELSDVDRDDRLRLEKKLKLMSQLTSLTDRVSEISNEIVVKSEELNDLEVMVKEMSPDGDFTETEKSIVRLESERDRFITTQPDVDLTEDEIEKGYTFVDDLRNELSYFQNRDVPLYSRKKRAHRTNMNNLFGYKLSRYQMRRNDLLDKLSDLSKRQTMSPSDIPNAPCAKTACPLFNHFMNNYENNELEKNKALAELRKLDRKIERISLYISALELYFKNSDFYHNKIAWLVEQSYSNIVLYKILQSIDLLTVLSTTPNLIAVKLKEKYDHISQWIRYKQILSDLDIAYSLRSRLLGSQDEETVKVIVKIDSLRDDIGKLRLDLDSKVSLRAMISDDVNKISKFEHYKELIQNIKEAHEQYSKSVIDNHELQCINLLKSKIEELKSYRFIRLSEIDQTLRNQSSLRDRYNEEIVSQIDLIDSEKEELERIEKALLIIPKKYTVNFVNGIFNQANRIIESVWAVPFKIDCIKEDDSLDYAFRVSGDNQSSREMSECSEGQSEILRLAINLALRIQLGYTNIPLCLDETGRTFDSEHRRRLITVLKKLLDDKIISQLFYISHDLNLVTSLGKAEFFVIKDTNIMLPEKYNDHVVMR